MSEVPQLASNLNLTRQQLATENLLIGMRRKRIHKIKWWSGSYERMTRRYDKRKKMENIYLMLSSISIVISSSLYVTFCVLQGAKSHLITIKSNSCPRSLFSHVLCLLLVFLLLFFVCLCVCVWENLFYFLHPSLAFIYYEWDRVLLISYCLLFHVVVVRAFFLRLL